MYSFLGTPTYIKKDAARVVITAVKGEAEYYSLLTVANIIYP